MRYFNRVARNLVKARKVKRGVYKAFYGMNKGQEWNPLAKGIKIEIPVVPSQNQLPGFVDEYLKEAEKIEAFEDSFLIYADKQRGD